MRGRAAVLPALTLLTVLSLALGAPLALAATDGPDTHRYLVGHDGKDADVVASAIKAAGGQAIRTSKELGFTLAFTEDPSRFERSIKLAPQVRYVERDDPTALTGSQWNGAQWNGAQWNGADWDGAQWNGAQWNGAQWNGGVANGAQWNSKVWESGAAVKGSDPSADPGLNWQWGIWATQTDDAWLASKGTRGAQLCVLDSGVAWDHRDLDANVGQGYNAIDPRASAYDDAGHGTHIAGIAAAEVGNRFGVAGIGNVTILPVKVLDATGHGHESDLAFGLEWCALQGADVAVMALSVTEADHPTLHTALGFAAARDVLLTASAGNDAGAVSYPARDPRVVAVSAVTPNATLATFSNRGPEVDLSAPGTHILSTFTDGKFVYGSGTSQAVGFVAGAAALLRDEHPDLTAQQARAKLESTAQDLGPAGADPSFGAGVVRPDRAL